MITTFEGLRIEPDYSFEDKHLPEIDVLVVASAEHSMDSDLENETLISFVRRTGKHAKYTLSLCDGAFVLAKAGTGRWKIFYNIPFGYPQIPQYVLTLKSNGRCQFCARWVTYHLCWRR